MIVSCTQCAVKLKIDESKIKEGGSKLKCPKCGNIFTVYPERPAPEAPAAPPPRPAPAPPVQAPAPAAPPPPPAPEQAPRPKPAPAAKWDLDKRRVLIGTDSESVRILVQGILSEAGYNVTAVSEGVEAVVAIEKEKPFLVILDVALPRIYGFEICDRLKNSDASREMTVILIASIYDKTRYKREPTSLYGADDYIEKHHIQDCILEKVQRLGSHPPQPGQKVVREEEVIRKPAPEELPARQQKAQEMRKDEMGDSKEVEAARRFARIIMSDIALYNQSAVADGIRNGTFFDLLSAELKEGRDLYNSRVSEEVRGRMDYFADEIEKFIEKKKRTMELGG